MGETLAFSIGGEPFVPKYPGSRDIRGCRSGMVVAIYREGISKSHGATWLTRCDCGNTKVLPARLIRIRMIESCGCTWKSQGKAESWICCPTYNTWMSMHSRVTNLSHPGYKDYGGRGISICERWKSFDLFVEDMGLRPPGLTLERLNVNGNYDPDNCTWATRVEQANNTRRTFRIEFDGLNMTLAEWARHLGISGNGLARRLKHWEISRTLTTKIDKNESKV